MSDLLSELTGGGSTDLSSAPEDAGDSYNYYTTGSALGNLSTDTGLSFIQNAENPVASVDELLYGVQPLNASQSLTPTSATTASPNLFSQLFSGAQSALSTPASANQSSLGQLFGNLASRLIQPLGQGAVTTPNTANLSTASGSIAGLLSNPLILIGLGILVYFMIKK